MAVIVECFSYSIYYQLIFPHWELNCLKLVILAVQNVRNVLIVSFLTNQFIAFKTDKPDLHHLYVAVFQYHIINCQLFHSQHLRIL